MCNRQGKRRVGNIRRGQSAFTRVASIRAVNSNTVHTKLIHALHARPDSLFPVYHWPKKASLILQVSCSAHCGTPSLPAPSSAATGTSDLSLTTAQGHAHIDLRQISLKSTLKQQGLTYEDRNVFANLASPSRIRDLLRAKLQYPQQFLIVSSAHRLRQRILPLELIQQRNNLLWINPRSFQYRIKRITVSEMPH